MIKDCITLQEKDISQEVQQTKKITKSIWMRFLYWTNQCILGDRIWIWENLAQDKGLVNEVGKDLVVRG